MRTLRTHWPKHGIRCTPHEANAIAQVTGIRMQKTTTCGGKGGGVVTTNASSMDTKVVDKKATEKGRRKTASIRHATKEEKNYVKDVGR